MELHLKSTAQWKCFTRASCTCRGAVNMDIKIQTVIHTPVPHTHDLNSDSLTTSGLKSMMKWYTTEYTNYYLCNYMNFYAIKLCHMQVWINSNTSLYCVINYLNMFCHFLYHNNYKKVYFLNRRFWSKEVLSEFAFDPKKLLVTSYISRYQHCDATWPFALLFVNV